MDADRVKRVAWVCACLAGAIPAAARAQDATAQVPTVTLNEAIELALRVQPAVVQARGDVRTARAGTLEATGAWLPRLTGSGSWSRNSSSRFDERTQTVITGASSSYSTGLSASLELFDGFRRIAASRAATAQAASAEADLTGQEFQITLQTKQAFLNALSAEYLVRISDNRIQRAEEQLKVAREKLAAGSATRSDTLRSAVEVGNARLQRLNAEWDRTYTQAALGRLIGLEGLARPEADEDLFVLPPLDTAGLRAELLRTAPTVVAAEAAARVADAQVAVARAQYYPTVTGTFSQNWSGPTFVSDTGGSQRRIDLRSAWSARLSLSWNVFNGFTRERNMTSSAVARDAAFARADDARRQASAQLTQQLATLASSRAQINISRASLAAAEEDLRVVRERYRLGAATIVEVLTSQVTLDQAEVDVIRARLDFLVARAQLEALVGRTL